MEMEKGCAGDFIISGAFEDRLRRKCDVAKA